LTRRRSSPRRLFAGLGLAILILAAVAPAAAQPAPSPAPAQADPPPPRPLFEVLTGKAKAEYEAGRILYRNNDYANAIIKFERSYELSREPRLLLNVALCQKNLKRYARMLATLEKLLRDAGPQLTAQERTQVTELIEAVQPFVSRLEIQGGEPGAVVLVDEEEVGTLPFSAKVMVDVGPHKFRVSKPGYKDFIVPREVAGGGVVTLTVKLEKEVHRGRLVVRAGSGDFIHIDGRMVGRGTWDGQVPSGGHTLRVTAPGMLAFQKEVMLQDDQMRREDVRLTPEPPPDRTERWLWIGGGAALLAGAVVAGVFLFQPEPPVPGNTSPFTTQVAGGNRGLMLRFGGSR